MILQIGPKKTEGKMEILFCDENIIVCIKPAGVISEDVPGGMPDLIRTALLREQTAAAAESAASRASGAADSCSAGAQVYAVHRLDKGVGGVMVYALTKAAAADLTRQITEKTFTKEYLAVVEGVPEPLSGRMEDLLFHSARENRTYVVKRMRNGVKEAALEYEVIKSIPRMLSLVRIRLLTGRTHQIRAQFSSRKLPLSGDRRYGAKTSGDIALWSHRLTFRHPVTGEPSTFEASPPNDEAWTSMEMDQQNRFHWQC